MELETQLIQSSRFELTASVIEFTAAITALARRVEVEGQPGILLYSFYVNADEATGGSLINFRDPETAMAHYRKVGTWPELQRFQQMSRQVGLRYLGTLSPAIRQWTARLGVTHEYLGSLAAGFVR